MNFYKKSSFCLTVTTFLFAVIMLVAGVSAKVPKTGDAPTIVDVSATYANGVADFSAHVKDDGEIRRVWAWIIPPNHEDVPPDEPVIELPSVDLTYIGDDLYEGTYDEFDLNGIYRIVFYAEDTDDNTSFPEETTITILKYKAIIVAGGGPGDWNLLWDATLRCTNYAFRALTYQGYDKDTVYYLSAGSAENMDAEATNANFEYAIKTWATDADLLFIHMLDHGGPGTFRMNENEILQAENLDNWLDELQENSSIKVVILYDACQSGSFLPLLSPPAGKERVLATSTESEEPAVFANNGNESFSYRFFANLFGGDSFYKAFVYAKKSIQLISRQRPRIDVNQNGIGSEDEDIELAGNIRISDEKLLGNDMPIIGNLSPPQTLVGTNAALLYAENVSDANGIQNVWAVIIPPDCCSDDSPDTPIIPESIELTSAGNGRYEATYEEFTKCGTYTISVHAVDADDLPGVIEQTTVIRKASLADAILALKTAIEMDTSNQIQSCCDANSDGQIGVEEAIYILQDLANLR